MSYLVPQDDWSAARRGDKATNLVTGMSGLIGATALVASVCMNSAAREKLTGIDRIYRIGVPEFIL